MARLCITVTSTFAHYDPHCSHHGYWEASIRTLRFVTFPIGTAANKRTKNAIDRYPGLAIDD